MSYQTEDLSSPLNFSGLMKRPDTGLIKNERERGVKTMATQNEEECNSDLLPFDIWLYNNLKSFKYDIIRRLAHRRGEDET